MNICNFFFAIEYPKFLGILGMGAGMVPKYFGHYGYGCGYGTQIFWVLWVWVRVKVWYSYPIPDFFRAPIYGYTVLL